MTSTTPAKTLIQQLINRINRPEAGDPYALLSENVVVTVNGTTPLSGHYPGLAMVKGILVDTARRVLADVQLELSKAIGQSSTVACQLIIHGRAPNDRMFNSRRDACSCVFDVSNGLITAIALYPDTSAIEMELYGRSYVSNDQ